LQSSNSKDQPVSESSVTPRIEMRGIRKTFGPIVANDDISLLVRPQEIHALLGENGAGKTTLMNVLYGLYPADAGEIFLENQRVSIREPSDAIRLGIGMVHQHFKLVEPFTVAQNIVLGSEITGFLGTLREKEISETVRELSKKYGLDVEPDALIEEVSVGTQQRVEILKALYRDADVLILDEPTGVLTPQEIEELISIMRTLVEQGKTIIIITHKLREIKAVGDRCTIIRRGRVIDTVDVEDASEQDLASMMVGRNVKLVVEKGIAKPGPVSLNMHDLIVNNSRGLPALRGFSLEVRSGEILGIAGVDGNGQTELVEAIVGVRHVESGGIEMNGVDITNRSPKEIFDNRVSSIPEDRQRRGLVLEYTVADNMILGTHTDRPFARHGVLQEDAITSHAEELIARFDVRPPQPQYLAGSLSGGNQQKVIIAREVSHDPEILIASQPTRGLDVGAIEYVHKSLIEQRDRGKAVMLVSLDLDEVMNVSDRIAVIFEGRIVGLFNVGEVDEYQLGLLMAGGKLE
jgi:general nucleoside transport system ATP-binding protein